MKLSVSSKYFFHGWSLLSTIAYRLQASSVDRWHESFCWWWSGKSANAPRENPQKCLQPANVSRWRLAGCFMFPRMCGWCLIWYKKCTPGGIRTHGLSLRRPKRRYTAKFRRSLSTSRKAWFLRNAADWKFREALSKSLEIRQIPPQN